MKTKIFPILICLLIALSLPMSFMVEASPKPGPATDTLLFKSVPVDLASSALTTGQIDYYIYALKPSQAAALEGIEGVELYMAPAGLVDIVLNPAPAPAGKLNPFSIREVRFACNYLMDRDYVVNQIYKGFAAPMVAFLSSYDPDYITIYDIIAKYEFKYDLAKADEIMAPAMTKAGAKKVDGKWNYGGEPIVLKFIIRTEDERRDIGDAFASALEKVGFTVNRQYMTFGQAIPIIYGTDPKDFEWMLYTEGWGKSALDKYDAATINQFGAPWYTWMPGYQEAGYWQYENSTIDELGKRILKGDFSSKAERDSLYKKCSEMIINEAVRIWAATRLDINPASSKVKGITNDLATGLRSPYNPREVYATGKTTLTIGHLWIWNEGTVWNPIAGHDDVYSSDMWVAVHDPFIWRHPFSGIPIPFRWNYEVHTAGPSGKLPVPEDAFIWDNNTDTWKTVGPNVKATSKVTFDLSKYIGSKWHHGETISWADVLFSIYQHFELAYDAEKSGIESSTAAMLKETLPKFVGFEIDGEKLIVYLDFWHFSDDYIADYADIIGGQPPMGNYPWEVLAGMDKVVFEDKKAAYSESASNSFGVPWLSLVLDGHAKLVSDAITALKSENYLPSNVFTIGNVSYFTSAEAQGRYDAAVEWYNEKKHMVISDGPYYLNKFDATAQYAELKAWRDATYPFEPGDWFFGLPTSPEIVNIGIPTIVPGGSASFVIDVSGVPPLGVKYLIKDPITAEILSIGDASGITSSRFVISLSSDFTKDLQPGLYEITLAGYSEEVAFVSSEKVFFNVLNLGVIQTGLEAIGKQLLDEMDALSQDISTKVSASNANLGSKVDQMGADLAQAVNALSTATTTTMYLVGILAVLVIVNIVLVMRKK
ncbi:hypothetical protein KEJ47_08145 [Candidatus Bathyarchaeota archaeon]|nr:hypothetical protein [Candidatus Bathyarchaeota archaeon]